ncbi:hypothetical protein BMI90_08175 [Thioclava sp. L04-15]|nr:hypothetical protein BMI90_08175 [Thioclava sp. L04-15]TNE83639.1 MAG: hypothetical protein EP337_15630 [Paracoccaceae bacterium]
MRRAREGDLLTAARVATLWPEAERHGRLMRLFDEAHAADLYSKRPGRPHPIWGDGTLMAAALGRIGVGLDERTLPVATLGAVCQAFELWRTGRR